VPWTYFAVVFVKDLEDKHQEGHVFRVEMHCQPDTTIRELQKHVEHHLSSSSEFSTTSPVRLHHGPWSCPPQAKLRAIVPMKAAQWEDVCLPDQLMKEVEDKYGLRADDPPPDSRLRLRLVLF
jgi:tRNA U55 pseudouridine synthase TruB